MLSPILRIPSGFVDDVNDAVIGGGPAGPLGTSKFAGQLGMEVELMTPQIRLKNPAVPVAAGKFQYVQLAAGSAVPAVGSTVNWDATANKNQYRVTATAGTAAGTALTANVTPGNYTLIQTSVAVPTGTTVMQAMMLPPGGDEGEIARAEADAVAKAKAEGKTDEEAAEEGRQAAKEAEAKVLKAKAKAEAEEAKERGSETPVPPTTRVSQSRTPTTGRG